MSDGNGRPPEWHGLEDPTDNEPCEELVVALVAALGTDLDVVEAAIEDAFSEFDYRTRTVRLSKLLAGDDLAALTVPVSTKSEYDRIKSSMAAGDELRSYTSDDFLAQRAVAEIAALRRARASSASPLGRQALILRSLKRPEEVFFLRSIYGSRLLVISVFVGDSERKRQLASRGLDEKEVAELMIRDRDGGEHGQATTQTFELGDLFLDVSRGREHASREIQRFLDLVFGSPLVTPTRHEHAMFLAFSASLRSGDLSRQVGAVVVTDRGAIVGEGANDAPRFGGGQ